MKDVLKPEIKELLRSKQAYLGILADRLGMGVHGIISGLDRDYTTLLMPSALKEIKSVLDLPEDAVITERLQKEETHLHE